CTTLIAQLLQNTALIGTRGYRYQGLIKPAGQTTPGSLRLNEIFTELLDQGAQNVAMEVSSHALDQGRVAGLSFDTVVFTGIGHDHLDYHGDLESYAQAKKKLFIGNPRAAVINIADDLGVELVNHLQGSCELLTYGAAGADLTARLVDGDLTGMSVEVSYQGETFKVRSGLIGDFNIENLLATAGVLLLHGVPISEVMVCLSNASPVPGRMERLDSNGPLVVVDYAHNPEGLLAALTALRPTDSQSSSEKSKGRLWCLFGCGGERDQAKRALMGRIASTAADVVVLTDDNPRHESPLEIVDQVVAGCDGLAELHRIHDRRQAITFVLQQAGNEDRVLIAGKGDEPDQLFAGGRWRFDDRRIARMAIDWRR
ncbi:MAG: UDP-N-acetylmuramoyl-L-alanyl-D-glutamate--2,6-diaminopimelate ligase, partial [Immundisolibacteraceae bacterium]|nr:UDP-N-acetylmuramoyl-L-alanyl-D-glutamate--2,6-diaminopimelate ligase [Immundisolibacteraceae bacterium]